MLLLYLCLKCHTYITILFLEIYIDLAVAINDYSFLYSQPCYGSTIRMLLPSLRLLVVGCHVNQSSALNSEPTNQKRPNFEGGKKHGSTEKKNTTGRIDTSAAFSFMV